MAVLQAQRPLRRGAGAMDRDGCPASGESRTFLGRALQFLQSFINSNYNNCFVFEDDLKEPEITLDEMNNIIYYTYNTFSYDILN